MNEFPSLLSDLSRKTLALAGAAAWNGSSAGQLLVDENPPRFTGGSDLIAHLEGALVAATIPPTGWLLWSEKLQIITGPGETAGQPANGWLLAAELHFPSAEASDDVSLSVQQVGREWRVKTIRRVDPPIDPDLGLPIAFLESRALLPWPQLPELAGLHLHYQVAWQLSGALPTRTYRPALSRFIGFHPFSTASS